MTRTQDLWKEAQQHLVGGVNSPVRSFSAVEGHPLFVRRAVGPHVVTEDGDELVDFVGSFGPLILGHSHPDVVTAICDAAANGTSFATPHEGELEIARRVKELIPRIEKLRMVNSGTEAVQSAVRLARGATGRDLIVKFEGCYHGHVDSLLVKAGSGLATFGVASSAGVPAGTTRDTLVLPLDDEAALEGVFEEHGDHIAAVIIEPLPANNGLLVQRPEFLRHIREECDRAGALLIFDEVISGFRSRAGTYGSQIGIDPDLYTLGKIIGGGLPVGAYGGPAAIMDHLAPLGPVYQAGTLSGNPLALAAGNATLRVLADNDVWTQLEQLGQKLDERVAPVLAESGLDLHLVRHESIFWMSLGPDQPVRRADRLHSDAATVYAKLHRQLLDRGWMLAPSAFEVGFLSLAHTPELIDSFASALEAALAATARSLGV